MTDILQTPQNFRALSVRDLLQARDLYHYHLLNKANVVGTAIGLYLIRKSDLSPKDERAICRARGVDTIEKGERTLENSEVRDYSWPCILAFVREWVGSSEFGGPGSRLKADQMVPKTLYLPDGRMVPVCVVKVEQASPDDSQLPGWHWPAGLFGGGMPIIVDSQEQTHRATAGCLVSDGHTTYALTSRHVCGAEGAAVFTLADGERVQIGVASSHHLTRLPFTDLYPEFAGHRTYVNLDVGLIELANLNQWTSQTFGLGPMGALADLNELNITTRLIDAPVLASGAASGRLEGRIKALFYRYKSIGGYDYVADFLIAPRQSAGDDGELVQTQPGDSGAVWHLVTKQKKTSEDEGWTEDDDFEGELRPLGVEWGGQVFADRQTQRSFAFGLATSLTSVCKALDVELVTEHNDGVLPYWGQMGHYSIGAFACRALPQGTLREFMNDNIDRISFAIGGLKPKEMSKLIKLARENVSLIPLADVPDLIWKKHHTKMKGGRDIVFLPNFRTTGPEHPTHYADIDEIGTQGQSLLDLSLADSPHNLTVEFWQSFYNEMGHNEQHERGLLPFRVWQFWDEMKAFAQAGDAAQFLCAAGLLSHYVGDACQPLHGSIFADGDPQTGAGKGVHSVYESDMIDRKAKFLVEGIEFALTQPGEHLAEINSGKEAALATLQLMKRSATTLPPQQIIQDFVDAGGDDHVATQDNLWPKVDKQTIKLMTDGARVLARIWQSAWDKGHGNNISANSLGPIDPDILNEHSRNPEFVKSLDLDHIKPRLH